MLGSNYCRREENGECKFSSIPICEEVTGHISGRTEGGGMIRGSSKVREIEDYRKQVGTFISVIRSSGVANRCVLTLCFYLSIETRRQELHI